MSVEIGSAFLSIMPSASGFGRKLEGILGSETKQTGPKVGKQVGTGVTTGLGKANYSGTAKKIGGTLAKQLGASVGGTIMNRVGTKLGDKIFEKTSERLKRVPWKRVLSNPALGTAAVAAGLFVARKFTKSANEKINSGFKPDIGGKLKGLKGGLVGAALSLVGGGILAGVKSLATQASDMFETVSKTRTIFGQSSKAIENWTKSSAKNLGMSRQSALEGASAFGNLFDQLNFSEKASVKMSKGFLQMATDAASFNNADPAEVMDAFLSATRGEYDALQKYIPTASAATIETEALRMTHKKSAKDLTAADKAAALYSVSVRDLGKAHGDFKRTSGGFANQQRILAANWADLKVKIGKFFLPAFTRAAVYMNTVGFPALTRIVGVLGHLGRSAAVMGKVVASAFSTAFGGALDKATLNLSEIANWMETHQEVMVRGLIKIGEGAIGLGRGFVHMAASAIRGFGSMANGLADFLGSAVPGIQSLMYGLAEFVGVMDPFGDKADKIRAAADGLGPAGERAATGLRNAGHKANAAASAFENKANPAFDKASAALKKVGQQEIFKARQRDAAALFAKSVRNIGQKSDVAKNKLHGYNIESGKGSQAQRTFASRVHTARAELIKKYQAYVEAGVKGKAFKKVVDRSRDALYREFRQMGFSRKEAGKLADKYSRVPKKMETKVKQPGMDKARKDTKDLDNKINGLNSRTVKIMVALGKQGFSRKGLQETVDRRVNTGGRLAVGGRLRGPGTGKSDSILGVDRASNMPIARVSRGEWVINAKSSEKYDDLLHDINSDRLDGFAGGGKVARNIKVNTSHPAKAMAAIPGQAQAIADGLAKGVWKYAQGVLGGVGHGSKKRVRWHGGTFTERFANTLKAAQKRDGKYLPVIQGGFRPRTSYSGSSHSGDAIDTVWNAGRLSAMKRSGIYAWHRTPAQGPWGHHIHGIPKKGFGYPAGSGKWQQGDAARGGNGLARGSESTDRGLHWVGENGPEVQYTRTGDKVFNSREAPNAMSRPLTIHIDMGDGLVQKINGVIDEKDTFKATVGRMR